MGERFWNAGVWFGKYKYLVFLGIAPIVLCYNWLFFSAEVIGPFTKDNLSYFGDAFAPLNTLFSGMALVGVVVAIVLQKKELEETRRQLSISADAHAETVEVLREEQIARLHNQQRAGTLFTSIESVVVDECKKEQGKLIYTILVRNIGETVFCACPAMYKQGKEMGYGGSAKGPMVLRKGEPFEITITGPVPADPRLEAMQFRLTYYDCTGAEREQRYFLQNRQREVSVACIEHGFPNNMPPV